LTLKTSQLFVTEAILSHYQSPVNCGSRIFTSKLN
jgi:hypothetical protein